MSMDLLQGNSVCAAGESFVETPPEVRPSANRFKQNSNKASLLVINKNVDPFGPCYDHGFYPARSNIQIRIVVLLRERIRERSLLRRFSIQEINRDVQIHFSDKSIR